MSNVTASGAVITIVETRLDVKAHPWWLFEFQAPCEVRALKPRIDDRDIVSLLYDPSLFVLRWAVHASLVEPADERVQIVVGIQRTRGMAGAPREFLSWDALEFSLPMHVFRLGVVPGRIEGALPYRFQPWPGGAP